MIDRRILHELSEQQAEIIHTKDGNFTLHLQNKFIHSKYSPKKEGYRLISDLNDVDPDTTLVIVFGCGLGYHLEALEETGFRHIIAIERDPCVFPIFNQVYDTQHIPYIIGPDSPIETIDSIFSNLDIQKYKKVKSLILRGNYNPDLYRPFEERVERLMKVKLGDFATRLKFEENWFINIIRNIPHLYKSSTVEHLKYLRLTYPFLIISAGPSLKNSLEIIENLKDKVMTIAVDTAVLPLYEAGIVPDFIYSLDSQVHNLKDFTMIAPEYFRNTILIYDFVVNSGLPHYYPGPKIISNTAHWDVDYDGKNFKVKSELVNWIESQGELSIGDVETGGSVATSAFHLAYLMGATDILLIGQDLAYSYGLSHSPSTPHYYRIRNMSNRLKTMESIFRSVMLNRKMLEVEGINGKIMTDFVLNNFKGWFEETGKNLQLRNSHLLPQDRIGLYNLTLDGARINFYEEVKPEEVCSSYQEINKPDKISILEGLKLIDLTKIDKIKSALIDLENYVVGLPLDPTLFERIKIESYSFLSKYFMREEMIQNRYERWDEDMMKRKIERLRKNIHGVLNDFR